MRHIDYEQQYIEEMRRKEKEMKKELGVKELNEYKKALYMIDMNNGFVNFGAMSDPRYNALVPEQLKMIEKFRKENEAVNFILEGHTKDATEFNSYPEHCVMGTPEADLIPELIDEQNKVNTRTYYKNSINGMLNPKVQNDLKQMTNLQEIVFEGICADLCVMDFARTNARFLNEINRDVKLFVVKNAIDTFDAPGHNREEWIEIALKVMAQAGIEVVENIEELENREKVLGLHR